MALMNLTCEKLLMIFKLMFNMAVTVSLLKHAAQKTYTQNTLVRFIYADNDSVNQDYAEQRIFNFCFDLSRLQS